MNQLAPTNVNYEGWLTLTFLETEECVIAARECETSNSAEILIFILINMTQSINS
jgi:hypothetical protein